MENDRERKKISGRVSLGLLQRSVEMVDMVGSYESFQLFKFELCTMQ